MKIDVNTRAETRNRRLPCLFLCTLLLSVSAVAAAIDAAGALPSHARASRYGSGWDCLQGYDRKDEACVRIEVPANAYFNSSSNRWDCSRGYLKSGQQCLAVKVPDNAYADD